MVIYSLTQHFRLPRLSRMCSYCTVGAPASTPPSSRQPAASPRTRPLRNRNTEDDRERSRLLGAGTEIGMKRARRRYRRRATWSGREDSNLRPQRPERCALTRLRYAPITCQFYHTGTGISKQRAGAPGPGDPIQEARAPGAGVGNPRERARAPKSG